MGDQPDYAFNIRGSGLTIYDSIEVGDPDLWIPSDSLEQILEKRLVGVSLAGLALRTRSKRAKELVCEALGYKSPSSFRKTNPRFPGQHFDTYVQKSNNLQIWNEELEAIRRYVLIRLNKAGVVTVVRVVNGDMLAKLDTTGTLTQKYQARLNLSDKQIELVSEADTNRIEPLLSDCVDLSGILPTDSPALGKLLSIAKVLDMLRGLLGLTIADAGADQERNRGAELHKIVCRMLGYASYADNGQFPDVRHQLLEVKLQTSSTIDLGLVTPASEDPLDMPRVSNVSIRHCDVRYCLAYGEISSGFVTITKLYLTTGTEFFSRFPQCEGKVLNKKLQLPLPRSFFD